METAFLVVRGEYDGYLPIRAFADEQAAQEWARDYNATVPWRCDGDKAVVERIDFVPAGTTPPPPGGPLIIDPLTDGEDH